MSRFKVFYLTGGRDDEVVEAHDHVDDGRSILFRNIGEDGSLETIMRLRADSVDHVETMDESTQPSVGEAPSTATV